MPLLLRVRVARRLHLARKCDCVRQRREMPVIARVSSNSRIREQRKHDDFISVYHYLAESRNLCLRIIYHFSYLSIAISTEVGLATSVSQSIVHPRADIVYQSGKA